MSESDRKKRLEAVARYVDEIAIPEIIAEAIRTGDMSSYLLNDEQKAHIKKTRELLGESDE